MDTERGFNDFFRLNVCSSLGGYSNDEWINDSVLRKFKDEVQGCRYLMLMMVRFKIVRTLLTCDRCLLTQSL